MWKLKSKRALFNHHRCLHQQVMWRHHPPWEPQPTLLIQVSLCEGFNQPYMYIPCYFYFNWYSICLSYWIIVIIFRERFSLADLSQKWQSGFPVQDRLPSPPLQLLSSTVILAKMYDITFDSSFVLEGTWSLTLNKDDSVNHIPLGSLYLS